MWTSRSAEREKEKSVKYFRRAAEFFAAKWALTVHHHTTSWSVLIVKRLDCCDKRSHLWFKTRMFVSSAFFCTTNVIATKVGLWVYHC